MMRRSVALCYEQRKHIATDDCSKMLFMKTSAELRYENLVALCEKHGGTAAVGTKAGISGDNLRQIIARTKTPAGTDRGLSDDGARAIEKAFKLERGWMDHDQTADEDRARDYSILRQLDVSASLGPGTFNSDYVEVKGGLQFKKSFLQEEDIEEGQGEVLYAKGESMSPTLPNDSVVLINRGDVAPRHGKVYLIVDRDEGLKIKRLLRERDGWTISSDNTDKFKYRDEPFDEERHFVLGRAIWFGSRL